MPQVVAPPSPIRDELVNSLVAAATRRNLREGSPSPPRPHRAFNLDFSTDRFHSSPSFSDSTTLLASPAPSFNMSFNANAHFQFSSAAHMQPVIDDELKMMYARLGVSPSEHLSMSTLTLLSSHSANSPAVDLSVPASRSHEEELTASTNAAVPEGFAPSECQRKLILSRVFGTLPSDSNAHEAATYDPFIGAMVPEVPRPAPSRSTSPDYAAMMARLLGKGDGHMVAPASSGPSTVSNDGAVTPDTDNVQTAIDVTKNDDAGNDSDDSDFYAALEEAAKEEDEEWFRTCLEEDRRRLPERQIFLTNLAADTTAQDIHSLYRYDWV